LKEWLIRETEVPWIRVLISNTLSYIARARMLIIDIVKNIKVWYE